MSRLIRLVCTWLLALALPFQGAAAASMIACAAKHPSPMAAPLALGHHAQASPVNHPHAVAASSATDEDPLEAAQDIGSAKCSVCAACCTQAALPATHDIMDVPDEIRAASTVLAIEITSHTPDAIERPPRPLTA